MVLVASYVGSRGPVVVFYVRDFCSYIHIHVIIIVAQTATLIEGGITIDPSSSDAVAYGKKHMAIS